MANTISFKVPSRPETSILVMDQFLGVDLTNHPTNIPPAMSPNAPNMIRDVPGKVRKAMGYEGFETYPDKINGAHYRRDGKGIIHAGTKLYERLLYNEEMPTGGTLSGLEITYDRAAEINTQGKNGCIKNVTVYGKTTQSGTGDPSPSNIREIHGVGRCDKYFVINGNTGFNISDDLNLVLRCATLSDPCSDVKYNNSPSTVNTFSSYIKMESGYTIDSEHYYLTPSTCYFFILKSKLSSNTLAGVQEFFANNPLTVWYESTAFEAATQVYGEIKVKNQTGYRGYAYNISQSIFDGDVLETNELTGAEFKQREYHTKKKIVFTGTETVSINGSGNCYIAGYPNSETGTAGQICSHYKCGTETDRVFMGSNGTFYFGTAIFSDATVCKNYLAAQYAAGTPVTIVYTLATPTETLTTPLALENADGELTITASGDVSAVIYAAKEVYSGVNDSISSSWQFDNNVIIVDGKELILWGDTIEPASNKATIPTVFIAKPPDGQGGTKLDPLNLVQPKYTETFAGTASATVYQLDFAPLDTGSEVKVEILQGDGSWQTKTETTHFSVNRTTGTITFVTAPGVSPLTGEDNVRITAKRTVQEYIDRINKCNFGILFGVNGAADRLFLSGNPDMPNYDWYSAMNDATYFGDLSYAVLGQAASAIVGYSVINDRLAAHKDSMEAERNVVLRSGDLVDNEPAFRIVNTLQGAGAIARNTFAYLATEPLFLTALGVYAITPQDVTGERYAQGRSYYLNGELLKENGLENAYAIAYKDMYWLCVNNKAYILDGMQPLTQAQGMPYSTRQYVGFLRTNWPARILWEQDKRLWFGSAEGKLYRMYDDTENPLSYSDDGEPITARWETQDISGKLFYKNKTFKYLALRLATAAATSVKISAMKKGVWSLIKEDDTSARYFTWSKMTWSKFTWSNDLTPKLIRSRARVRKTDKARFAFENNALNEPFGIFNLAFEYREGGNAK